MCLPFETHVSTPFTISHNINRRGKPMCLPVGCKIKSRGAYDLIEMHDLRADTRVCPYQSNIYAIYDKISPI
jgi:hypothetical protein